MQKIYYNLKYRRRPNADYKYKTFLPFFAYACSFLIYLYTLYLLHFFVVVCVCTLLPLTTRCGITSLYVVAVYLYKAKRTHIRRRAFEWNAQSMHIKRKFERSRCRRRAIDSLKLYNEKIKTDTHIR